MGFLQRSRSATVTDQRSRSKEPQPALPFNAAEIIADEKRSTSFERPKTADSTSFSRPRTANAAIGRTTDWGHHGFKIDVKAADEIFSFPMPSPCPKPLQSATGKRVPSPLLDIGSHSIGVAIGSPSQAVRPTWGRSVTADDVSPRMPARPPPAKPIPAIPTHPDFDLHLPDLKKRKSGWKTLGGLFTRRNTFASPEKPMYKLKMPNAIEERDMIVIPDLAELPERGTTPSYNYCCSTSLTRSQGGYDTHKAASMPNSDAKTLHLTCITQKDSFSPMFRTINGIPEDEPWVNDLRKDSPLSMVSSKSFRPKPELPHATAAPTLDLDLPDPKFDRYSVMFEKLLLESTGPSLLERRQSKLKRGQSIKKLELSSDKDEQEIPRLEVNGVPQRGATSPGLTRSLSFRIAQKVLSPVTEAFTALNRPRPIRRSKTAPSSVTSPRATTFPTTPTIEVQCSSPPGSACTTDFSSLPPTPMTFTTISDSGSFEAVAVALGTDAPLSLSPVRRSMQESEPSWDMVSERRASAMVAPLSLKNTHVNNNRKKDKPVVQVSVARQVYVSAAMQKARDPNDVRPLPLRARMVELFNNNRTSTAMLIRIAEE